MLEHALVHSGLPPIKFSADNDRVCKSSRVNRCQAGRDVGHRLRSFSHGERMRAGEVSAQITSRFHVRSSAFTRDLTPADRLIYDGRTYSIYGIKELEGRKRLLEITAGARVDK